MSLRSSGLRVFVRGRCSRPHRLPIPRHKLAAPEHRSSRGHGDHRLGHVLGVQRHEIRLGADTQPIVLEAQRLGACLGHHVECDRQVLVGVEAGTVADHVGPAQHVAVAIGPPGVADVVVAAEHRDAGAPQQRDGREGAAARCVGHDGDAARGQRVGGALHDVVGRGAQRIGVADGDMAGHAECAGARGDLFDLEDAEHARIMQMDIDVDAVPVRDAEHHVEVFLHIAVEARRIDPADEIGAHGHRLVEQLGRACARQDAALRKRDQLDIDDILVRLAHGENGFERSQSDTTVDHHMAAHRS